MFSILMLLTIVPIVYGQSNEQKVLATEMSLLREDVGRLCDDAIIQYRSEADTSIQEHKAAFVVEVESMIKKQRFVFMVTAIVSAFVGAFVAVSLPKMLGREV